MIAFGTVIAVFFTVLVVLAVRRSRRDAKKRLDTINEVKSLLRRADRHLDDDDFSSALPCLTRARWLYMNWRFSPNQIGMRLSDITYLRDQVQKQVNDRVDSLLRNACDDSEEIIFDVSSLEKKREDRLSESKNDSGPNQEMGPTSLAILAMIEETIAELPETEPEIEAE